MRIPILYEDSDLLVIDKPAGIVVDRSPTQKGETVEEWVQGKIRRSELTVHSEEEKAFNDRGGIVHRLDKETSGCLILAKTAQVFAQLQRQFKQRSVKKTYLAIVHGKLVPQEGEIRAPIGRLPWHRERFGIVPGGKEAMTRYKVQSSWFTVHGKAAKEETSLVELYPETGRTHQIRVHMKYIGHPIVGDFLYAGRKTSRSDRLWAGRVMLHAWKISFVHPETGKTLAIEAPIPDDMESIIHN